MSEHLFFDPGSLTSTQSATIVADLQAVEAVSGVVNSTFVVPLSEATERRLIVSVEENHYQTFEPDPSVPADRSIFDPYPFLFEMHVAPKGEIEELQARAALELFRRLANSNLDWPLVLTHEFEILIATYDVERGVREFPPGTRSDGTDEHLWR